MFVSTIIATIGRKSLSRAVKSVLSQGLQDGDYEVIVVNDTKKPLIGEKLGNQWMSYPPLGLRAPYFYPD